MIVARSLDDIPASRTGRVVTIGKFDGVHRGHRRVIDEMLAIARDRELEAWVVTFDRNPLAVINPAKCPKEICSNRQKIELVEEAGCDGMLLLPFTDEVRQESPDTFAREVLEKALNARVLIVGSDFRYGRDGRGTVDTLREFAAERGVTVVTIDDIFAGETGERASSTMVRGLLATGDVEGAAKVLGRPHRVRGEIVHGAERGRELGFPTANLEPTAEGLVPDDGVYAGWANVDGRRYAAAISVGNNPTFDGVPAKQVEAHLLDMSGDLYGKEMTVEFTNRIRGMVAYRGIEPLIGQMKDDVRATRVLLGIDGEPAHAS